MRSFIGLLICFMLLVLGTRPAVAHNRSQAKAEVCFDQGVPAMAQAIEVSVPTILIAQIANPEISYVEPDNLEPYDHGLVAMGSLLDLNNKLISFKDFGFALHDNALSVSNSDSKSINDEATTFLHINPGWQSVG